MRYGGEQSIQHGVEEGGERDRESNARRKHNPPYSVLPGALGPGATVHFSAFGEGGLVKHHILRLASLSLPKIEVMTNAPSVYGEFASLRPG